MATEAVGRVFCIDQIIMGVRGVTATGTGQIRIAAVLIYCVSADLKCFRVNSIITVITVNKATVTSFNSITVTVIVSTLWLTVCASCTIAVQVWIPTSLFCSWVNCKITIVSISKATFTTFNRVAIFITIGAY